MTVDPAVRIGLRLRRSNGRIIITESVRHIGSGQGRCAFFLLFSRDIPDATGPGSASDLVSRAERGVLLSAADDPGGASIIAMTGRHPELDAPHKAIDWIDPPRGGRGTEVLFVPLFADLVDLAGRMNLSRDLPVSVEGDGPPFELLTAPFQVHGAKAKRASEHHAAASRARHHLLFRPDRTMIEKSLSEVPDASIIGIYDPDTGHSSYDFYPHVHRRGLHLVHATAGEGRALSDEEWRILSAGVRDASIPLVRLPERPSGSASRPLDLETGAPAFILAID